MSFLFELEPTEIGFGPETVQSQDEVDAQYAVFAPHILLTNTGGTSYEPTAAEVFEKMKGFSDELIHNGEIFPGRALPIIPEDISQGTNLGDTLAHNPDFILPSIEEADDLRDITVPEVLKQLYISMARVAIWSGFNPGRADINGSIFLEDEPNSAAQLHQDGTLTSEEPSLKSVKLLRFIYALGEGTLIYPKLKSEGQPVKNDGRGPMGRSIIPEPTEVDWLSAGRMATPSEDEFMASDAQQVMPGYILTLDPSRRLWHQAPEEKRPFLVVDIRELEFSRKFSDY